MHYPTQGVALGYEQQLGFKPAKKNRNLNTSYKLSTLKTYSTMKHLRFLLLLVLPAMLLTACSDEDENTDGGSTMPPTQNDGNENETAVQCYVINQGNNTYNISGSLDFISASGEYRSGVFKGTNGVSLGDGPQRGIAYGTKVYIPMNGSNCVWVIDKTSCRTLKQIETKSPEAVCAAEGYVFVSNNEGYVSRIDTAALNIDRHIAVGPNPMGMAATGGKVYVAISDGYNNQNNYADGKRLAVVGAKDGLHETDIACGLNPTQVAADTEGNLFVLCMGNYADVPSTVQKISADTRELSTVAPASLMALRGTTLYLINGQTDWATGSFSMTTTTYNTLTAQPLQTALFSESENPAYPTAIDIHPATGDIFICSDPSAMGYSQPGNVYRYDATGKLQTRHNAGVHPFGVVFI